MEKKEFHIKKYPVPSWVPVLLTFLLSEGMLCLWTGEHITGGRVLSTLLFAAAFGGFFGFLVTMAPVKHQKWLAVAVSLLQVILVMAWYFIRECFNVFMPVSMIFSGAENVANGFMDTVGALILRNWLKILLLLLPSILFLIFGQCQALSWKFRKLLAAAAVGACLLAVCSVYGISKDQDLFGSAYDFDHAVHAFGLDTGLVLDVSRLGADEEDMEFMEVAPETEPPTEQSEEPGETNEDPGEPEETVPVYKPHVLDLDYEALSRDEVPAGVQKLHKYVASQKPDMENEYTSLFKGKNLIFISAEAFSREAIREDLTPTLYRMANQGIKFLDYYQPNWGGGTSGGEFANMMGLTSGAHFMSNVARQNMIMSMGFQLGKLGYRSGAYHNNVGNFYNRTATHTHLGYDEFIHMDNGMRQGVEHVWPQSDLEMFQYVMPRFLNGDKTPFNLYFMSVSGHSVYSLEGNAQARKNYHLVEDLNCSEPIKCYLAANIELEKAMAYLLQELEKNDLMDDTVVVIAADHFPYGLEKSTAWANGKDYLEELYGYHSDTVFQRDHNRLIIWSGCLEGMDLEVSDPTSSIDILPTLSNLFGLTYDSRLFSGRDVFSDSQPLVIWNNYNWRTRKGSYDALNRKFYPNEGESADQEYIDRTTAIVKNKLSFSNSVLNNLYFKYLQQALESGK